MPEANNELLRKLLVSSYKDMSENEITSENKIMRRFIRRALRKLEENGWLEKSGADFTQRPCTILTRAKEIIGMGTTMLMAGTTGGHNISYDGNNNLMNEEFIFLVIVSSKQSAQTG